MNTGPLNTSALYVSLNFQAAKMWDTWTQGGPPLAVYNRSPSGWFDMKLFEDWFFKIGIVSCG